MDYTKYKWLEQFNNTKGPRMWYGKRIKYLYYIKNTIDIFKNLKANNKDKKRLLNTFNNYLSEEKKVNIKSKINPISDNWPNLLCLLLNNISSSF